MMNWKYLLTGVLAGSTLVLRAAGEVKDERPNILFTQVSDLDFMPFERML